MKPIRFPYGRSTMEWTPPPGLDVTVLDKDEPPAVADSGKAIGAALDAPLDADRIEAMAHGARTVTIVVTDATRPCPDHLLVPAIADRLNAAGVADDAITVLVAIGMHRPSTAEEKVEKLGEAIVRRFRTVDSSPLDDDRLIDFGESPQGVPVRIDRTAVDADLLIATGIVEPHQYAGFSGGWKTVAIGTASAETIGFLHGMRYLEDPDVRLASTDGNPFLESARWIGRKTGLRFVVNVALDSERRIVAVKAGEPETVHRELSAWVGARAVAEVDRKFPIVIGAAGHPKDSNLYQATRIPTYICFGSRPVVEEGGVVIVPAACPEGAGQGPGERLFFQWLSEGGGPDAILEHARTGGYPAGGQRAVMVAWAMKTLKIAIVGAKDPAIPSRCGFESFAAIPEAVEWAVGVAGGGPVLAVPRALTILPQLKP